MFGHPSSDTSVFQIFVLESIVVKWASVIVNIAPLCAAMNCVCSAYREVSNFEKSEVCLKRLVAVLEREKMTECVMYADGEEPEPRTYSHCKT